MEKSDGRFFADTAELEHYGENIGRSMKPMGSLPAKRTARALRQTLSSLERRRRELSKHPNESGAGEWLMDNGYLAKEAGLAAVQAFAPAGRLRAVTEQSTGEPAPMLLLVTMLLAESGGGRITPERCEAFLKGFQRYLHLNRRELGLFVPALRTALLMLLERSDPEDAKTAERVFTSLRLLRTPEFSEMTERADRTEQLLRKDPSGIYPQMDEGSRAYYRSRVETLARRFGCMEHRLAEKLLRLAEQGTGEKRHVGWYLFREPLGQPEKRKKGGFYIALQILLPLFFALLTGFLTGSAACALLTLFLIWEFIRQSTDRILLRFLRPAFLPRLELKNGIPPEGKTVCALSVLLTGKVQAEKLTRRMETFALANRDAGENLLFLLLADLPESAEKEIPMSGEWFSAAKERIEELNEKYGERFFLMYREREYCAADGKWRGRERKRGALLELARLLRGRENSLQAAAGNIGLLRGCRYILALDADTELCPGTARELVGTMLHPLNRPVTDRKRHIVTAGHGVLAPRMAVDLQDAGRTAFARLFAGQGGTDPYGSCCGEISMDLFGQGGFAGKGLLDAEAFIACMEGRIPDNRVLSHDILEGAFLRCGYVSDVELADGFPARPKAWLRRRERWTRGDWQNLPWLFRRGKELPSGERWRIFDDLRRSLTAPTAFICLLAGLLTARGPWSIASYIALGALAADLLASLPGELKNAHFVRFHSHVYPAIWSGFLRLLMRLMLLPAEAFSDLGAILTALWRMLVSHRNMLQWQTAAQTEAAGEENLWSAYNAFWPCLLTGAVLLALASSAAGLTAGILWLLAPALTLDLGRETKKGNGPEEADRAYLLNCGREMWGFFRDFCREEDHFLPPDNFQKSPPVGVAHRTSPTNIGLCLLCALAAMDMELETESESLSLISHILDTLEHLPKWQGHIFNWIDTRTLEALQPAYISTVDSGNLAACLSALACGLREKGQSALACRADKLFRDMDFRPLYDEKRQIFHIGRDADADKLSEGRYDLLSSEARLTAYVAIAKGDVPRKHWRYLSRALLGQRGYRGMASWTGSMFEYLMPEILLPLFRDSLLYETAEFCLQCQKKRTAALHLPWGASESAYSALDNLLNYRYKAHGVSALALRRGMDDELVIAPYASFLALPLTGKDAAENLRHLELYGGKGEYGFWDAVDFTASRLSGGTACNVVRCVMAHHVGMSLLSVCNYLQGGIMQRRFMAAPEMRAFQSLLQERIPTGGILLRRSSVSQEKRDRHRAPPSWEKSGECVPTPYPECCVLSNGFYNIMLTENGEGSASCRELMPHRDRKLLLRTEVGDIPLLPCGGKAEFRRTFTADSAAFRAETPELYAETVISVAASEPGEAYSLTLRSKTERETEATLILRLEAVLAGKEDYVNHPTYYGLGLHARMENGTLIIRRLPRGRLEGCALALSCDRNMEAYALRDRCFGVEIKNGHWLTGGRIELRVPIGISPQAETLNFALCVAKTETGAADAARRVLHSAGRDRAVLPGACVGLLGLQQGLTGAYELLRRLHFLSPPPESVPCAREELWRLGISGDLPVVWLPVEGKESLPRAAELLRQHGLLSACGQHFDVALLDWEQGYQHPLRSSLLSVLRGMGREDWLDRKGGVRFVSDTPENRMTLLGAGIYADAYIPQDIKNIMSTLCREEASSGECAFDFGEDGTFRMDTSNALPPRAWSHILTNGGFGCMVTEHGTGHLWYRNAREAQIMAWHGDVNTAESDERLNIIMSTNRHDLLCCPVDGDSRVEYGFGTAVWYRKFGGLRVKTTAFVPPARNCRILLIETDGAANAFLEWSMKPLLASNAADRAGLRCRREGDRLTALNPRFLYGNKHFSVAASGPFESTCSRDSLLLGIWDDAPGAGENGVLALRVPLVEKLVLVCGMESPERLREMAEPENAEKLLEETAAFWREKCSSVHLDSPDERLNAYFNGWAIYQTYACRMLGRCSMYQNGGAFGFRDQLQDSVNLLPMLTEPAREMILAACRHQYPEGDVMHWWHETPTGDKGVRTRCSDDLLWLPWALCEYAEATGDESLAWERTAFAVSAPLSGGEESRYECPGVTDETAPVMEHCFRALERCMARGTGAHGLPLILGGDWNDGFDRMGAEGRGESVWLGWFFAQTAERFADLAEKMGCDLERTERLRCAAESTGRAADAAWDGEWYLRGYFDDGTPVGTKNAPACRIDSIAQSFAAFCKQASPDKTDTALRSAEKALYSEENRLVRLFTPPFGEDKPDPGYITSYGPGFRENGGQYTHGALWLAMALLRRGETDRGYAMLRALLPGERDAELYGAEPYVLAADVYSAAGHEGRAGWSWYTGSAGWMLRIILRELLGVRPEKGGLTVTPKLPALWEGFTLRCRDARGESHTIIVTAEGCTVDGRPFSAESGKNGAENS